MTQFPRLNDEVLYAARCLWKEGCNTLEIAKDLLGSKDAEAIVANSLAAWRDGEYQRRTAK